MEILEFLQKNAHFIETPKILWKTNKNYKKTMKMWMIHGKNENVDRPPRPAYPPMHMYRT